MLPIVWNAQAEDDLLSIIEFIGERDPWAAERLGEAIRASTWPLPEHPYLFRPAGFQAHAKSWPIGTTSLCTVLS